MTIHAIATIHPDDRLRELMASDIPAWARPGAAALGISHIPEDNEPRKKGGKPGVPVEIDGRSWPSCSAFAKYVGRDDTMISRAVSNGDIDKLRDLLARREAKPVLRPNSLRGKTQGEIAGLPPLVAPEHIAGQMTRWTAEALRNERAAWALAQSRAGYSSCEIGKALGIAQTNAAKIIRDAAND